MNAKQPSAALRPAVPQPAAAPGPAEPSPSEPGPGEPGPSEQATASAVFEVMRRLVLEQEDRRGEVSEVLGISFSRTKALRRLVGGPRRMNELTAILSTDKPYTTLIVDDLERRGLVQRTIDPEDRRCKIVTITGAGLEVALRAEAILARPPKSLLALDDDELTTLERLLAKL